MHCCSRRVAPLFFHSLCFLFTFLLSTTNSAFVFKGVSYPTNGHVIDNTDICVDKQVQEGYAYVANCNEEVNVLNSDTILVLHQTAEIQCSEEMTTYYIENENVIAVLLLDLKPRSAVMTDTRKCFAGDELAPDFVPFKQLASMGYENSTIVSKEIKTGDFVSLSWQENHWQELSTKTPVNIALGVFIGVWVVGLITTSILFCIAILRKELGKNLKTFLFIEIFLCCICRILLHSLQIYYTVPFYAHSYPRRFFEYLSDLSCFSAFAVLSFNWSRITFFIIATTFSPLGIKIWKTMRIITIVCSIIITLFLLQSALFSTLYPDNISLLLLQFILLPPLFIFFIFLGAGYIIVLKVLNDVAESSTNSRFAVRKVTSVALLSELGLVSVMVAVALNLIFGRDSSQKFIGVQVYLEISLILLIVSLFVLLGYQEERLTKSSSEPKKETTLSDRIQEFDL